MKKILLSLSLLTFINTLKAQESHPTLQKGKLLLETNFSPFGNNSTGFSYQKTESITSLGVGAALGYFIADKLAIKGDANTNYPKVKNLFEGLRDIEYYKFWLITSQETNK